MPTEKHGHRIFKLTFAYGGGRGGSWLSLRKHGGFRNHNKLGILKANFLVKMSFLGIKFCLKTRKFEDSWKMSMLRSFCNQNCDFCNINLDFYCLLARGGG